MSALDQSFHSNSIITIITHQRLFRSSLHLDPTDFVAFIIIYKNKNERNTHVLEVMIVGDIPKLY